MGKDPYPGFYPPERGRGFPFPDPLLEGASSPLRGKEVWGTGNGGGGTGKGCIFDGVDDAAQGTR